MEKPASGAMEGRGAYNRYAKLPAGAARLALPHLEEAAGNLPIESGDRPIVIADYGASQGKNSLAPLRAAIGALRAHAGYERSILVYQQDLPANDFNSLFGVLDRDPDSYAHGDPNVFPCAIGRSFYGAVLPPAHVDLGWSSYAVMWASRVPSLIPGHISVLRATGDVRLAFDRQGAEDWESFLAYRSAELRHGGRLVIVLPASGDDGLTGFETIMDCANDTLKEMVAEGAITADELRRMVLAVWPRSRHDLLAPFVHEGRFLGLTVERTVITPLLDAAWLNYLETGDKQAFAGAHALFFRSIFAPTLALALDSSDAGRSGAFSGRLEQGMRRRVIAHPSPMHSHVATIVLAKGAN